MRSLLARRWLAAATPLLALGLLTIARPAATQERAMLQGVSAVKVSHATPPATDRLEAAQHLLFAGRYAQAAGAFATVLESGDARGIDTLTSWAYHGMALAEALAGNVPRARSLYDQMLRTAPNSALAAADSIEAFVLSHRWSAANPLLDRFAKEHPATLFQQYVHSFRALEWMLMGRCREAIDELTRAPDPGRPLPQAVRGRCAVEGSHRAESIALRDSVLTHPLADPMSWPMIVARGVALGIR